MKPVWQTTNYNCVTACVASLLEIDIKDIPILYDKDSWIKHAKQAESGEAKHIHHIPNFLDYKLEEWLRTKGMITMRTTTNYDFFHIKSLIWDNLKGAHAVVGYGNEIVHDPEPLPCSTKFEYDRAMPYRGFNTYIFHDAIPTSLTPQSCR